MQRPSMGIILAVSFSIAAVGTVIAWVGSNLVSQRNDQQNEQLCDFYAQTSGRQALANARRDAPEGQETVTIQATHGPCVFPR